MVFVKASTVKAQYIASVQAPPWTGGSYQGWMPCMEWCRQVFGGAETTNVYMGRGWRYCSEGVFEFERESDRTAFLLRWG